MDLTTIGSYRILDKVGEGGMGCVYLAEHIGIRQRAAIKTLLPAYGNHKQMVARFLQEAKAAAAISDPGIVKIFDQGTLPDGTVYIVMEYLEGETLAACLQREVRLSPWRALVFARQAARALSAAHLRGIVHRDLKPDNLYLVPDSEVLSGVRIKVLDFGIAKLRGGERAGLKTQEGAVMGTPAYMSPEQWQDTGGVDGRSDLYSLGCILFEMLAGARPFPGPELYRYLQQHCSDAPPPLPDLEVGAQAEIASVVDRLLAKERASRFSTADELVDALSRALQLVDADLGRERPLDPRGHTIPDADRPVVEASIPGQAQLAPAPRVVHAGAFAAARPAITPAVHPTEPSPLTVPSGLRTRSRTGWLLRAGLVGLLVAGAGWLYFLERDGARAADLLRQGDQALAEHLPEQALRLYRESAALGFSSPQSRSAQVQVEFHTQLLAAERSSEAGELDRALDAYDRLLEGTQLAGEAGRHWTERALARRGALQTALLAQHLSRAEAAAGSDPETCRKEVALVLKEEPQSPAALQQQAACAPPSRVPQPEGPRRATRGAPKLEQSSEEEVQRDLDQRAQRFLAEGSVLRAKADYPAAIERAFAALRLHPSPSARGPALKLLGICYAQLKDGTNAAKYFRLYLSLASPEEREQVRALIERYAGAAVGE